MKMKKIILAILLASMVLSPASTYCDTVSATQISNKLPYYSQQLYTGTVNSEYEKANDPLYNEGIDEFSQLYGASNSTEESTINWGAKLTHANSKANTKKSYGIDVSKWQRSINWTEVANSGVEFAIIRLGYRGQSDGTITLDPMFETNIRNAYSAEIKLGVYFYTQAITTDEAKAEADFCADTMDNYKDYLSYPIMFDIENTATDRIGNADLSTAQRTEIANAFCEEVEARGYKAGVYSYKSYLENKLNMSELENYYIWLANYGTSTSYAGAYDMWQYSDNSAGNSNIVKISVPGISTLVDLDVAYEKISNENSSQDEKNEEEKKSDESSQNTNNLKTTTTHSPIAKISAKAATCLSDGNTAYYICECGKYFSDEACTNEIAKDSWIIPKLTHTGKTAVRENEKAPTYTAEGSYDEVVYCAYCGTQMSRVSHAINKKTLPKVTIKSVKSKKSKNLLVKWTKVSGVEGYQIQYSKSTSFKNYSVKTVESPKSSSATLSKLKKKKKYYIRIRAYVIENGKKTYSDWSAVKSCKIK